MHKNMILKIENVKKNCQKFGGYCPPDPVHAPLTNSYIT